MGKTSGIASQGFSRSTQPPSAPRKCPAACKSAGDSEMRRARRGCGSRAATELASAVRRRFTEVALA